MTNLKFEELQLSEELIRAVKDMGFEEATPIQSKAITKILDGRDIIGQSQTGTGKTAAFGLPCIDMIDVDNKKLQAVILSPTRELAIQICEEFRKFLKYKDDIKVLPVYGGQPIERQIGALKKGVQIVVGTPGRIMDHMNRRTLKMETVKMVVLDEADEMLDMGFRDDIEAILDKMPDERQTVLFSATMAKEIMDLTDKYLVNPEVIKVARKELTVPNIEQIYFEIKEKTKVEATSRLMDMYCPELVVIFCNTKKRVDELVEHLQGRGYFAEGLHGDLKQIQRDIVMKKFRNRTIEILVATDVAARGIDVDDVDMVINYDLPQDEEYYVHRIGRTGRAGRSGRAFSFVVGREIYKLRDIMKYTKAKVKLGKLPSLTDIEEAKTNNFIEKVKRVIEEGRLTKYINIVESIVNEDISAVDISAALLKMNLYDENTEDIDFEDDLEDNNEKLVRLFINVGSKKRVRAKDIVGAIAGECGIPGKAIGDIDIYEDYTFLDVPKKYVKDILKGMKGKKIKKVTVKVERAKKR
ncbi:DEAD/DEAH box helicase [uncultured Tyzzerella sp.]|uniref:DEAD/DEAH box helicase n=1 Tax=uncultured Tyzzerella sp. TaxID=2321398 RepID=UPI0029433997|nr:DEAD/DEAH box helicase [uncultured Tyzzerella sp.]